jgi:cation:H+ antiporter
MMAYLLWIVAILLGVSGIVWGAEAFARHLAKAATRLGVSTFALALLLAGAEPEELATAITASVRHAPAIALGDIIGANVTICLVALGVGALIAPLPFHIKVLRYALLGLPLGVIGAWFAWDGNVTRVEGAILVFLYIAYVAMIWIIERKPPSLGETEEIEEAIEASRVEHPRRLGPEILLVMAGLAAMAIGSMVLVEGTRRIAPTESGQATLGLRLVGFATGFELVVLAWSTARRGASEAAIAAVVGSFAYNTTMTLGAAAVIRPLVLYQAAQMRMPFVLMIASLGLVIALALRRRELGRYIGATLLVSYGLFVCYVLLRRL